MDKGGGVSFHRLFTPFARLQINYGVTVNVSQDRDEWHLIDFSQYDCVVFSRWTGNYHYNIIEKIKSQSKLWVDNDDYWVLPKWNPAYKAYKKVIKNALKDSLQFADVITTTTEVLAREMQQFTSTKIDVIPNCLDLSQSQWNVDIQEREKFAIGWVGGSSHEEDLKVLGNSIKRFCEQYNAEFVMCGHMMEYGVWHRMEQIVTGESIENRPEWFKTVRASTPDAYGSMYRQFDIAIAPLTESRFNSFKSELKMIEAAAYKMPIICSDVEPYNLHAVNLGCTLSINNEDEWFNNIVHVYKNHSLLGELNYNYCQENYDISKWTKVRYDILCSSTTNDHI